MSEPRIGLADDGLPYCDATVWPHAPHEAPIWVGSLDRVAVVVCNGRDSEQENQTEQSTDLTEEELDEAVRIANESAARWERQQAEENRDYAERVYDMLDAHDVPLESLTPDEQELVGHLMCEDADPAEIAHVVLDRREAAVDDTPHAWVAVIVLPFAHENGLPRLGSTDQYAWVGLN